jgi:hypothetical protein
MGQLAVREGLFVTISWGSNSDLGFAEISALLAALGILIYALGLLALCWPIYRRITRDASTALYAVSLMPKTVVAGQGVRILFGSPFILTVTLMALFIVQNILLRTFLHMVHEYGAWVRLPGIVLITAIVLGAVLFLVLPRMRTVFAAFAVSGVGTWASLIMFAYMAVVGVPIGLLTTNVFFESEFDSGAILPSFPGWVTGLKAVTLIFILNCVQAFTMAFTGEPPLPEIALNGSTTAEGRLVAHAYGIWYILDDEGNLVGIPDDKAGRVLVSPN